MASSSQSGSSSRAPPISSSMPQQSIPSTSHPISSSSSSSSQQIASSSTTVYPVTASLSAPVSHPPFIITPIESSTQAGDEGPGGLIIAERGSSSSIPIPWPAYQRLSRPPSSPSSSLSASAATRRPPRYHTQERHDGSEPWFHVTVVNTMRNPLTVSHHPPADPAQAPPLILSHRSGLNHKAVDFEDSQLQACEDAARRSKRQFRHSSRSQVAAATSTTPTSLSKSQPPVYTPSTSSATPSISIDTTNTATPTPASELSLAQTPLSPSLKSDRATDDAAAATTVAATGATQSPTKPLLPAWSQPRSWAGMVNKNSGATSFTIPQDSDVSTQPTNSAAVSEIGSPTVTSPKINGKSVSSTINKAWTGKQRRTLEDILADSHTKFNAPLTLPRGLINKGNFCFANAILQVLVFCAPFYNLFNTVGKELAADLANSTPLIEAVVQFLREFHLAPKSKLARQGGVSTGEIELVTNPQLSEPFVPEFVYEAMRLNKRFDLMRRGHQEDAEEFLGFFLDTLHEELLAAMRKSSARAMSSKEAKQNGTAHGASNDTSGVNGSGLVEQDAEEEREVARPVSPTEEGWMEVGQKGKTAFTRTTSTSESPITRIFGGKLRSVLRTPGAKDSVTLEPYQPLQLDIQPPSVQTIEDALLNLTVPETIPGVFSMARGGPVDATKQVFIERTPPVLILHLKRFFYDEVGGVQKNSKEVGYSDTLDVGGEMVSPPKRLEGSVRYKLFGVVYHHGRYASGGHYTVDVLRQDSSSWVHFDDTMFNSVAKEHVGRKAGALPEHGPGHDGLAYLLFYKRQDISDSKDVPPQQSVPTNANANTFSAKVKSVNGMTNGNGRHTRESSSTNRYTTSGSTSVDTISSPKSTKKGKKLEESPASPQQQQQQQATTPRTVPGAPPGKGKKVKS
ncbi:unnamed protein product [Sympodiomycopsis kandeliae]